MFTAVGFERNEKTGKWTNEVSYKFERLQDARNWVENNFDEMEFLHVLNEKNEVVYTVTT